MSTKVNAFISSCFSNKCFLLLSFFTLVLFLIGYSVNNLIVSCIAVYLMLIYFIIYVFKVKKIVLLMFTFTLSFFILNRPISAWLLGIDMIGTLTTESAYFALFVSYLCLLSLKTGDYLFERFGKNPKESSRKRSVSINSLRISLIIMICISAICFGISQIDKLNYFASNPYVSLYTDYTSSVPSIIRIGARFFPYAVICYLATCPKMLYSCIALAILIISRIPDVIIGSRQWIVLYFIFSVIYLWLRQINKNKYIVKYKKLLTISLIIIVMAGFISLGKIGYKRSDEDYSTNSWKLLLNITYAQSTTFDTIRQIYDHSNELPNSLFRNYSFGNVIENIEHNKVTEILFGIEPINNHNSIERATSGYSMAHQISYIVLGNTYLEGYGIGTSYLAEAFIDSGYLGVMLLSIIVGYLMAYISKHPFNNWLTSVIKLNILILIFYLPRESFGSIIDFLFSLTFWLTIIGSILLSWTIEKFLIKIKQVKIDG